jgi:hypothetical protein
MVIQKQALLVFVLIASLTACGGGDKGDDSAAGASPQSQPNTPPPVASVSVELTAIVGVQVSWDGTNSTGTGGPLTYSWRLVKPAVSSAYLNAPDSPRPSFTPDVAGAYQAFLIVKDNNGSSVETFVSVEAATLNFAPMVKDGNEVSTATGVELSLNGNGSSDANGDALTYQCSVVSQPDGSQPTLAPANSSTPSFKADFPGDYKLALIVNDGKIDSAPSYLMVTAFVPNKAPVAVAPSNLRGATVMPVVIDGSQSYDPESESVTGFWMLKSAPIGGIVDSLDSNGLKTSFTPQAPGEFVFQFQARDSNGNQSLEALATISVTSSVENLVIRDFPNDSGTSPRSYSTQFN